MFQGFPQKTMVNHELMCTVSGLTLSSIHKTLPITVTDIIFALTLHYDVTSQNDVKVFLH